MSVWIRDDGTITDDGDPTAFEYVPAHELQRCRFATSKKDELIINLQEENAWLEYENEGLEDKNHRLEETVQVLKGQIQQMNMDRDHPDNPVEA